MANVIFSLVECKIQRPGKSPVFEKVTFKEIAIGVASVNKLLVKTYMKDKYGSDSTVEIIDVGYFQSEGDYEKYIKAIY